MKKHTFLTAFILVMLVPVSNDLYGQSLNGTWVDTLRKTKHKFIHNGNSLVMISENVRFTGVTQGDNVQLWYVFRSLSDVPQTYVNDARVRVPIPEEYRRQLVNDSTTIKGSLYKMGNQVIGLRLVYQIPAYSESERKWVKNRVQATFIRNPLYFFNRSNDTLHLVTDVSHPYPVIELNIDAGDVQLSNDRARVQIKGKVRDPLADIVADGKADIKQVQIVYLDPGNNDAEKTLPVPVTKSASVTGNDPWRPFAFEGTFEKQVTIPAWKSNIYVYVKTTNAAGNTGFSGFVIRVDTNSRVTGVDVLPSSDPGYFNPVMVRIYDPTIDPEQGFPEIELVGGAKIGLEKEGGNAPGMFRGDRPIIALAKPLEGVPNVFNGLSTARQIPIKYKGVPADFFWSVTTHSPPNYFKYAAGMTVDHEVRSNLFYEWPAHGVECMKTEGNRRVREPLVQAQILETLPGGNGSPPGYKVRLTIAGNAGVSPEKTLTFNVRHHTRNDDQQRGNLGAFKVLPKMKTVLVTVDGLGFRSITNILNNNTAPVASTFQRIFRNSPNLDRPVLSALPTITWCNWPGIFSMQAPKDHGVIGNAFFERERRGVEPFATPNKAMHNLSATLGALMTRASSSSGSLYDSIARAFGTNAIDVNSIHQWYHKSNTRWVRKEVFYYPGATHHVLVQKDHSAAAALLLDELTGNRAPAAFCVAPEQLDILTIYFPGPDNIAHTIGNRPNAKSGNYLPGPAVSDKEPLFAIREHMEKVTDRHFKKLIDSIERRGYLYATVFGLTADHSLHAFHNTPDFNLTMDGGFKRFFENLNLRVYTDHLVENLDQQEIVVAPNGGLAHIYVNSNTNWQLPASKQAIEKVASRLFMEAVGGRFINPFSGAVVNYTYRTSYRAMNPKRNSVFSNAGTNGIDYGALGTPPAIFVKVCEQNSCFDRGAANHFKASFRWVKFVDDNDNITYSTVDSFLLARAAARNPNGSPVYPEFNWPEFALRLDEMNDRNPRGSRTGDIVIITDGFAGYMAINDKDELNGWHGGPSESESYIPLLFNVADNVVDRDFIRRAFQSTYNDLPSDRRYLRNWELGRVLKKIIEQLSQPR